MSEQGDQLWVRGGFPDSFQKTEVMSLDVLLHKELHRTK